MIGAEPVVDLPEHVAAGRVPRATARADVVDRIPPEAIDVVVFDEHLDLGQDVIAHFAAPIIRPRGAPVGVGFPIVVEVDAAIAARGPAVVLPHFEIGGTVVVVDDVDQHGDAVFVAGLDESLEGVGPAVGRLDGEGIGRIVAPRTVAGKFVDGHEFHRGNAEHLQISDLVGAVVEGGGQPILGVVRAGVHLVDHEIVSPNGAEVRRTAPIERRLIVDDGIAGGIDDAGAARIFFVRAVDHELVFLAGAGAGNVRGPIPVPGAARGVLGQRAGAPAIERAFDRDGSGIRRPRAKGHAGSARIGVGNRPHAAARRLRQRAFDEKQTDGKREESVADFHGSILTELKRFRNDKIV